MKRRLNHLILALALLGILALLTACTSGKGEAKGVSGQPSGSSSSSSGETKLAPSGYPIRSDKQGTVEIDVAPVRLGTAEERNEFKIDFNTHSVDLDFDFAKLMTLKDDLGNDYAAESWTGSSGGHHVGGNIIFPSLKLGAKKVMLTITGVEGLTRSFGWELK